nr:phosphatidylinositol 4-kinase stt4 [Quercus suber]
MLNEMYSTRRSTRRNALDKLAALAAQAQDGDNDIQRLCELQKPQKAGANGVSAIPMTIRELEVLTALAHAAPLVQATGDATSLLQQLIPYVPEAHRQVLGPSLVHQHLPPWESLSYDLTSAVLALARNHPSLRGKALACVNRTVEELARSAEEVSWLISQSDPTIEVDNAERALPAIQLTVSLLGFLSAISVHVQIWSSEDRILLLQKLRKILSEQFMVSLEGALSAVRNARTGSRVVKEWKRWARHYASRARPLGAMLLQHAFMQVVEESVVFLLVGTIPSAPLHFIDTLLKRTPLIDRSSIAATAEMIDSLTEIIVEELNLLEADADYLQVSSAWQQSLAFQVKACSLRSFMCCSLLDEDIADDDILMAWLDGITTDAIQMADDGLAQTVLKCMAIMARTSSAIASNLTRSLPRLIVQGKMTPGTAALAGECLARAAKQLSQDVVISTLYSLGNVLSTTGTEKAAGLLPLVDGNGSITQNLLPYASQQALGSALSLVVSDDEETAAVYGAIIQAIVAIANTCADEKITALVISMLVQKIGRVSPAVDARIVIETAATGCNSGPNELRALLRLYTRISSEAILHANDLMSTAVLEARVRLAHSIRKDSPLYEVYLHNLLSLIVSCGDTAGERTVDIALASQTIAQLLRPVAILASADSEHRPDYEYEDELRSLARDAWFNIVVHGFTLTSARGKKHAEELQMLAQYTLPLVDENRLDMPESGIDLNTVLRRGANPQNMIEQKSALIAVMRQHESHVKSLAYPDCIFLNAALLVSALRAKAGDCTTVLSYFTESKVKTTAMGDCMSVIAIKSVDLYLERALSEHRQKFAAPQIAQQLVAFLEGCCHRILKVQEVAIAAVERIVNQLPSALCQKASLFALLELLSLMWQSCLDAETDEYDLKSTYSSEKGKVILQLSDDVEFRKHTLGNLHMRAQRWVRLAIGAAPLDVKGLLQAYLEDYEDDGAYGHIAFGRSFAVEIGAAISSSDQRLRSLDSLQSVEVNTASDFIAQYTTRQEYRHQNGRPVVANEDWALVDYQGTTRLLEAAPQPYDEAEALRSLARRVRKHETIEFTEIRDTLRNAAGVLSRTHWDQTHLIQDLVGIPYAIFTKQSINLGISLWLGIIKENPTIECRVLAEIAAGWESSVRLRKGFFDHRVQHLDPFYVKEEFAPSKWDAIMKRQQLAHNLLSPHLRLTHFLSSHFNASRLTSSSVERMYARLMRLTMLAMTKTATQPLAREVHFHMVLLALQILKHCTTLSTAACWRLKDSILSAGLAWFAAPPRWSFGSNRLQVRAEVKILSDVINNLVSTDTSTLRNTRPQIALLPKQELLVHLLRQESERLAVWITPLGNESRNTGSVAHTSSGVTDIALAGFAGTAWAENPRIAIHMAARFPSSQQLAAEVRQYITQEPEKAIDEPDALNLLLGSSLPSDIKAQLKYLLYWAPINPMAAVTYFLPAYRNHPLIIQYAVRALESHSVDICFFYVPQIVQALRYDALQYVERYIIETAQFSQLFAHQIIWNIKANAFKDEESLEPDPAKSAFDQVMGALIASFSGEDQSFYEREFDFFGKVTGISGTLKPFIKRPKPEKKQKIEEELRKIQVEVGVYLPSNPDGVVIGIDRKSGKPLQSHAKAPYMATFRIRKEEADMIESDQGSARDSQIAKRRTYEVWQSAIFKVGDDCRQDILALQLIAAFRGIFNNVGLDVYVFPYRVTATAPGCGVIDVLPNSISRDMLGREAVNGLYEYFVSKYGTEDSIRFQKARSNFIKSMAAYSIISYLLQFKDRHNGNIMVDDAGHILHIDFGFCFDIVPGGVKFERAPFKLSPEMVAVMGGTQSAQFRAFEELCVKVFLASRQYVEQLSHIILTMLDSGLPCFKPTTLQHFKERFVLDKSDREAAEFVRKLVGHAGKDLDGGSKVRAYFLTRYITRPVLTRFAMDTAYLTEAYCRDPRGELVDVSGDSARLLAKLGRWLSKFHRECERSQGKDVLYCNHRSGRDPARLRSRIDTVLYQRRERAGIRRRVDCTTQSCQGAGSS